MPGRMGLRLSLRVTIRTIPTDLPRAFVTFARPTALPMNQNQLSLPTRLFRLPIRQSLQAVGDAGVRGVQLDLAREVNGPDWSTTALAELKRFAAEIGLTLQGGWIPLKQPLYEEQGLDTRLGAIRNAIQLAGKLRLGTVCFRPGRLPRIDDEKTSPAEQKQHALLIEVLTDLARVAEHAGVTLCLIPSGDAPAELKHVSSSISTGRVAIDFDTASFAMNGVPVAESLVALHGHLGHITLRDGVRDFQRGGIETAIGEGSVPWLEVVATLEEMDYRGWLTSMRTQGDDLVGDVLRSVNYFQSILPRAF
ncbi:MAG: hypothetical protein C0478_08735 [Planctomyces sp.]|nr:hypothetical protein [Planctomyces sp.]